MSFDSYAYAIKSWDAISFDISEYLFNSYAPEFFSIGGIIRRTLEELTKLMCNF